MAAFASFLVARKVVVATLTKHLCTIKKVLVWRQSIAQDVALAVRLQAVLTWLEVLQKQSSNAAQPSTTPLQHSKLPHAKEVIAFQLQVEEHAATLTAAEVHEAGKLFRPSTATACQDAAQLALMFGYVPPLRLACIRSCLHPDAVQPSGGCMDEQCKKSSCQGNRLEWLDTTKRHLKACFPHHKCESKWQHMPIEFQLPPSLTSVLMPWITAGHNLLAAPGQRLLFVHPRSGMDQSNVYLAQVRGTGGTPLQHQLMMC